jgi:phosphoribosylformylglycinamidine (FGAM) synthase-like enzyme
MTMDFKDPREGVLCAVRPASGELAALAATHRAVAEAIAGEHVLSSHDISDGGLLVAVAEMCIGSGLGASLDASKLSEPFAESNGRYVIEVHAMGVDQVQSILSRHGAVAEVIGRVSATPRLDVSSSTPSRSTRYELDVSVDELTRAWRGTLDW